MYNHSWVQRSLAKHHILIPHLKLYSDAAHLKKSLNKGQDWRPVRVIVIRHLWDTNKLSDKFRGRGYECVFGVGGNIELWGR